MHIKKGLTFYEYIFPVIVNSLHVLPSSQFINSGKKVLLHISIQQDKEAIDILLQLKHLIEMRVDVSEMVHVKIEVKADITLTGAGGLTVGDWVEVEHDFTPGNNSGGGVGVITDIVDSFSFVRYIIDGHTEKFVPFKRLTTIPMPFRRKKA